MYGLAPVWTCTRVDLHPCGLAPVTPCRSPGALALKRESCLLRTIASLWITFIAVNLPRVAAGQYSENPSSRWSAPIDRIFPIGVTAGCDKCLGPESTGVQRRRIISAPYAG